MVSTTRDRFLLREERDRPPGILPHCPGGQEETQRAEVGQDLGEAWEGTRAGSHSLGVAEGVSAVLSFDVFRFSILSATRARVKREGGFRCMSEQPTVP
jgi:hypothetical protein